MEKTHQYPKGDLRRMLSVLAAIDSLSSATLVGIAELTGIDKKTVTNLIKQAREQAGLVINKDGPEYFIADWGPVIKRTGARKCLVGEVGQTESSDGD